jgi:hypothetical protein
MAVSLVPYWAKPVVAKPAVTSADRKVRKIVFLITLILLLLQTCGLHVKLCAKRSGSQGERLKMVRTADSPSNNAQQNGRV